jgi:hypothetical protein
MIKKTIVVIVVLGTLICWGVQLPFSGPSSTGTNVNAQVVWQIQTNFNAIRYTCFWTPLTNVDTGTNWATTTNWSIFADCNSSTTNAGMNQVPTNSYVTLIVTVPGGLRTTPVMPLLYTNQHTVYFTNQLASP